MSRRGNRKSRFDINPLIGVVLALGLIGAGHVLEGGRMGSLMQVAAALIVFGGTLGAVLISFSFADLRHAIASLRNIVFDQARNPEDVIASIGRFAVKARKEGIMKLEDDVEQADDPFLRRGLSLAVDGATPTTIRTMLEGESMSRFDSEEADRKSVV